jgi:hypothetical protein
LQTPPPPFFWQHLIIFLFFEGDNTSSSAPFNQKSKSFALKKANDFFGRKKSKSFNHRLGARESYSPLIAGRIWRSAQGAILWAGPLVASLATQLFLSGFLSFWLSTSSVFCVCWFLTIFFWFAVFCSILKNTF